MEPSSYRPPLSELEVKKICKQYSVSANTNLGQHFLIDETAIEASLLAADLKPTDTVLEIGPGLGVLTDQLAQQVEKVIAIELDTRFQVLLQDLQTKHSNLKIIYNDFFKVDLEKELGLNNGSYKVVANLPYNITSHFLKQMLTQSPWPSQMVLMIQKEVAERIVAEPGDLSILALSVQLFSEPKLIKNVPAASFFPAPAIDSAIIAINNIRQHNYIEANREKVLFSIIKAGFAKKRKKLIKNLENITLHNKIITQNNLEKTFSSLEIEKNARAQEISLEKWLKMLDKLESFVI